MLVFFESDSDPPALRPSLSSDQSSTKTSTESIVLNDYIEYFYCIYGVTRRLIGEQVRMPRERKEGESWNDML